MAKGNLFQGMARGKVGDVVFYRMNGWQMSRVRNRRPHNPRTNEQLYQRAVIATTMKSYSAGKEIFDHAFQGYTIGEGCMRRFNSLNARILRNQLISDINNQTFGVDGKSRFVAPKGVSPVAQIGLQVSEGTLTNNLLTPTLETQGMYKFHWATVNAENNEMTVKQYLDALKISAGDLFTLVVFSTKKNQVAYSPNWTDSIFAKQYVTRFGWIRMTVRDDINDTTLVNGASLSQVFNIESDGMLLSIAENATMSQGGAFSFSHGTTGDMATGAVIRSRLDMDIRSTEFTVPLTSPQYGIDAQYVLGIWQDEIEKVGTSELILEGGNGLNNAPTVVSDIQLQSEEIEVEEKAVAPVPTTAKKSK